MTTSKAIISARSVDYLEDEVASTFFEAREYEAYYRSLKLVDERRNFHDQLRHVLRRMIMLSNGDGLAFLDELINRTRQDAQRERERVSHDESPAQRVLRMEPYGMQLLGNDAGLDFKNLRAAYRSAALLYHPDRGGSHEKMIAINRSYELLHRIFIEEKDHMVGGVASDDISSVLSYIWSVQRLLFEISLDDWALDEAMFYLKLFASDKERSQGRALIDLIDPMCKLTERLYATGNLKSARKALIVAQEGLQIAKVSGLNYERQVEQAAKTVSGVHKPRFIQNHMIQIENAFRLGAIDQKSYETKIRRIKKRNEHKAMDWSRRLAILAQANFQLSLPIDSQLTPSRNVNSSVPHTDYYNCRADGLTSDQQAEYLMTFKNGTDLNMVSKYTYVRLSSLIRSAIYYVTSCDLALLLDEIQLLEQLEPRCAYYAKEVADVIRYLLSINDNIKLKKFAASLANLLGPPPKNHLPNLPKTKKTTSIEFMEHNSFSNELTISFYGLARKQFELIAIC